MAIHSTAFGATKLTQKDSEQFQRQVARGRSTAAARKSLDEGKALLRAIERAGHVRIKTAR